MTLENPTPNNPTTVIGRHTANYEQWRQVEVRTAAAIAIQGATLELVGSIQAHQSFIEDLTRELLNVQAALKKALVERDEARQALALLEPPKATVDTPDRYPEAEPKSAEVPK